MNKNNSYYNWFSKVITIFIELFFVCAILSTLYVFTYAVGDENKIFVFVGILLVYGLLVCLLKNKVKDLLVIIIEKLKNISIKKMVFVVAFTMLLLKILFTIFFYFDPSIGDISDIGVYDRIATNIVSTGRINTNEISHLLGIGLHLAFFKLLKIPYHIGIFIIILIGTLVNFFSFKSIIGKEKSFIITMLYILMPSTILLMFCPTHEVFLYLYISLVLFFINKVIKEDYLFKEIIYSVLIITFTVLTCFVNPAGNLLFIIISLIVILSKINNKKKVVLGIVLILSLISNNFFTKSFNLNEITTTKNAYSILIHGSSIKSNGEHVDKYAEHKAEKYLEDHNIEFTRENELEAYKAVLIEQYKELLSHPIQTIRLLIHKFYVEWSGNHYPVEMAYNCNAFSYITYYLLLAISAIIYLFVLSVGLFLNDKQKDDNIFIQNYQLLLLGVVGLLLVTLVLNKYSIYTTMFIYLISLNRIDVK